MVLEKQPKKSDLEDFTEELRALKSPPAEPTTPPKEAEENPPDFGIRIPGGGFAVDHQVNLNFGRRIYDPDWGLRLDDHFYEKFERDEVIADSVEYLKSVVTGQDYSLKVTSEDYEPLIPYFEAFLERIRNFQEAKENLCNAIPRGLHAARI